MISQVAKNRVVKNRDSPHQFCNNNEIIMNKCLTLFSFYLFCSNITSYFNSFDVFSMLLANGTSLNNYGTTKRKVIYVKSLIDVNGNRT